MDRNCLEFLYKLNCSALYSPCAHSAKYRNSRLLVIRIRDGCSLGDFYSLASLPPQVMALSLRITYEYWTPLRHHEYGHIPLWIIFLLERCAQMKNQASSILEYHRTYLGRVQFLCTSHARWILFAHSPLPSALLYLYFRNRVRDTMNEVYSYQLVRLRLFYFGNIDARILVLHEKCTQYGDIYLHYRCDHISSSYKKILAPSMDWDITCLVHRNTQYGVPLSRSDGCNSRNESLLAHVCDSKCADRQCDTRSPLLPQVMVFSLQIIFFNPLYHE